MSTDSADNVSAGGNEDMEQVPEPRVDHEAWQKFLVIRTEWDIKSMTDTELYQPAGVCLNT